MTSRVGAASVLVVVLGAAPGYAQAAGDRPVRRIEVEAGGGLLGGAGLGSRDASLVANEPARRPFLLFRTDSRAASAPAVHVRAAFAFTRRLAVEGGLVLTRPAVGVSTRDDVEGAPALTVLERIDQYFIEAGLVILIDELRAGSRTVPFVAAGAGYLRQLHEGRTVVEHGHLYHAGGGVKHWLVARNRGLVRAAGLRADARLYFLAAGMSFDERPTPRAAVSGSVFVAF